MKRLKLTGTSVFVCDSHLSEGTKIRQERLIQFLDEKEYADNFFLVGDIFDFWFEYRRVVFKEFFPLLNCIYELSVRKNKNFYFLPGNHDFWVGKFFSQQLGINSVSEKFVIDYKDRKIFLCHGDGLNPDDSGYLFIKSLFRSKITIKLFYSIHPDLAWNIARFFSQTSRSITEKKSESEIAHMEEFAALKISEGYDIVIMGHSHIPVDKTLSKGRYINLGNWIEDFTYLEISEGSIKLKEYK